MRIPDWAKSLLKIGAYITVAIIVSKALRSDKYQETGKDYFQATWSEDYVYEPDTYDGD